MSGYAINLDGVDDEEEVSNKYLMLYVHSKWGSRK